MIDPLLQRKAALLWQKSSVTTVLSWVLAEQEIHVVRITIMPAGYGGSSPECCQPHPNTHNLNVKHSLEYCGTVFSC